MWLKRSNRNKHFLYAIPIGVVLTILCVIGLASGLEFKDKLYGNKWYGVKKSLKKNIKIIKR